MSQPPAIPNLLRDDQVALYFVTFCVAGRARVLANPEVFGRFVSACGKLVDWQVFFGVVMPDHIHVLMAPLRREASVKDAEAGLKRWTRTGDRSWRWQQGCFDRLLRNTESGQSKWEYIRENPVRAGLVKFWDEWPYRVERKMH